MRNGRVKSHMNLRPQLSKLRPDSAGPGSARIVSERGSKEKSPALRRAREDPGAIEPGTRPAGPANTP
jgi:hypothetical protein